jgi:hypothetical protein
MLDVEFKGDTESLFGLHIVLFAVLASGCLTVVGTAEGDGKVTGVVYLDLIGLAKLMLDVYSGSYRRGGLLKI